MHTKYELTDERHPRFSSLRRIRALRDIPGIGVKAGDLGGWVESKTNLSQTGTAWVYGGARVSGDAHVFGDARVYGDAHLLTAGPLSSENDHGTLTHQQDGSHQVTIGCWAGTVDDLRALVASDEWPSGCDAETRARYAPRLLAFADLCTAQIGMWR